MIDNTRRVIHFEINIFALLTGIVSMFFKTSFSVSGKKIIVDKMPSTHGRNNNSPNTNTILKRTSKDSSCRIARNNIGVGKRKAMPMLHAINLLLFSFLNSLSTSLSNSFTSRYPLEVVFQCFLASMGFGYLQSIPDVCGNNLSNRLVKIVQAQVVIILDGKVRFVECVF